MADENKPPSIDHLLARGDEEEKRAEQQFLAESRPQLVAGKQLAWDGFWRRVGGGLDSMLWSWFGGAVDVARAQEQERAQRRTRRPPNAQPSSDAPPPDPSQK